MYTFVVLVIVVALGTLAYILFLQQKGKKLSKIQRGFCPECDRESITIKRSKSMGCSGTTNVIYRCEFCGYEEEFHITSGGCGSRGCGL
ncbi:hypothetical protein [Nitratiruptor sp. YY09-18]|uniref:hypothetical protein n=1 Tax=Nitratiruptor sp. YY09-18 TaxID=2724901 RepID=UPI00191669C6|nr:hypothetical protein [Nitratiruptor sp. YY09-18]BCD68495.1 hypothetical protein NitYY0918_C1410 [Nitratiruptor sp. YY09-18]